ncbi:hypothetical protein LJC27_06100 [Christensenellaceae bacterium OttesenSCG-928-M15]|nr:hypothetical protein [Christensenellaceae bacterium OttesenSCG-928-M15]
MKNILKAKLLNGEKPLGMFTVLGGTITAECLGMAGLDYFILDTEHGVQDVESVLPALIAAERRDITPLVRVKDHSRASVLKMLDAGAMGLVVPFIHTVNDVKTLVNYAKYAPLGCRGYGIVRASGYGLADYAQDTKEYFELSNAQTLLLPQCETKSCLDHIEEIASLEGVDGIFVGPYDLSVALGVPGQMDDDSLNRGNERVRAACDGAGKFSFIFAGNAETANRYFHIGYSSVTCSVDAVALVRAVKSMTADIKRD